MRERFRRKFGGIFLKIPKVTSARSSLLSMHGHGGGKVVWLPIGEDPGIAALEDATRSQDSYD